MTHTVRVLTTIVTGLAVAIPATLMEPRDAQAQGTSQIEVLVAPLITAEGVDRDFGEKVAEEVREALEEFSGMVPLDWGDVRDQVEDYGLDWKELTAIEWRQLAARMNAHSVMVGHATREGNAVRVEVLFVDPRTGDELEVPTFTVASDDQEEEAAAHIASALEEQVAYQRSIIFCQEYLGSDQLEDALRNCDAALEINPSSARALYLRGRVHMEAEDWEVAREDLERVVEVQASNTEALQSLAYTHAQLGNAQRSLELYREYLNFNPDDAEVRLNIAYRLASTEAYAEAMAILEEGVARDDENVALWKYLGDVALTKGTSAPAGAEAGMEGSEGASGSSSVRDREAIERAVEAYDRVLTLRGDSINPGMIRNLVAANMELGDLEQALEYSERGLELIRGADDVSGAESAGPEAAPEETQTKEEILAGIHDVRASIYARMENYEKAAEEIGLAVELNPELPRAMLRRGNYRLKMGDTEGAISDFRLAVDRGFDANQIANTLFATGYQERFQRGQYRQAIELFDVAAEFAQTPQSSQQIHFFMAYGYFQIGSEIDRGNEQEEACQPARRALSAFQQVGPHLQRAGNYQADSQAQIRDAVDVQVYRQQQIIKSACD